MKYWGGGDSGELAAHGTGRKSSPYSRELQARVRRTLCSTKSCVGGRLIKNIVSEIQRQRAGRKVNRNEEAG